MTAPPLLFPETGSGVAQVRFKIDRIDYSAPEASGRTGGVQAGLPRWEALYAIEKSDAESGDEWYAFVDRLRGRQRLFIAGDMTRPYPKAYPAGFAGMARGTGGAFNGAALSWAQNINLNGEAELGLTGLPGFFNLTRRDYIGFKWDAAGSPAGSYHRRALVRIVQPVAANAVGAVTCLVEPPIDPRVVPIGAVAHFDKPAALFKQDVEKTELGPIGTGSAIGAGTFFAVQDLRP